MRSNGTITDLGAFGLDPVGEAINNHGVFVGQSSLGAWIWSEGVFQNLNNLIPPGSGFTLDNATAINDNGQIAASRSPAQGQEQTLLTQLVSAPRIYRPPRLIHAGRSGRLRGARDCSHHLAERTDTGGGPP
jgi:hypothetical protein